MDEEEVGSIAQAVDNMLSPATTRLSDNMLSALYATDMRCVWMFCLTHHVSTLCRSWLILICIKTDDDAIDVLGTKIESANL
jgi:hypothetical protein